MSLPIFTDEPPAVEARGDLFVYTYAFNDEKLDLVLTRHAALYIAMETLGALDDKPRDALIHKLEAAK